MHNLGLTDITGLKNSHRFLLTPNPTSGKFKIESRINDLSNIEVFNVFGEKIFQSPYLFQQLSQEIDLSFSPKGIYYVKIFNETNMYFKKVIVQ